MNLNLQAPTYPLRPIGSIQALVKALNIEKSVLLNIAERSDTLYRKVKMASGSTRQVFDAKPQLKRIHSQIKKSILARVDFPSYLTGSLKGRDYKVNAELHVNQAVIICEDVKSFFNAVSDRRVFDIWSGFFRFPSDVASILTRLCTKDGALAQGAIPSSYLANLALWRDEPYLQANLIARGIIYSRYVDDIVMSSTVALSRIEKTKLIADVYGMLRKNGLSAKREKHEITPATKPMIVTKLLVNRKASLPKSRRANARTAVSQIENLASVSFDQKELPEALQKAAQRVGQLGRFHPNLAAPLKVRLAKIRNGIAKTEPAAFITRSTATFPLPINQEGASAQASPGLPEAGCADQFLQSQDPP